MKTTIKKKRCVCGKLFLPKQNGTKYCEPHRKMIAKTSGREHTRMIVRIRDNFTCQECGDYRPYLYARRVKKRLFDVHHIEGLCGKLSRAYDSVDSLDTMVTICHKCHYNRHDFNNEYISSQWKRNLKRNAAIRSLRDKGLTYDKIAERHGITRQRVQQIVKNSYSHPLR